MSNFEIEADNAAAMWLKCSLCGETFELPGKLSLADLLEDSLVHSLQCRGNVFLQAACVAETAIVTSLVLDRSDEIVGTLQASGEKIRALVSTVLDASPVPADDVCNACGEYVPGGADPAVMSQHDCEGEEG